MRHCFHSSLREMHLRFQLLRECRAPSSPSQEESRHHPKVREPGIDHDIGKDSFAVCFILCEQAPDIIQILHSPQWIIHKGDNLQKHQGRRRITFSMRSGANSTGRALVKTCSNPTKLIVNGLSGQVICLASRSLGPAGSRSMIVPRVPRQRCSSVGEWIPSVPSKPPLHLRRASLRPARPLHVLFN
jgi:hypothetical protein